MRYTAPRLGGRLALDDGGGGAGAVSMICADVTSAVTLGVNGRPPSVGRSGEVSATAGMLRGLAPPLNAVAYSAPFSSVRSVRISWNGESRSTNPFPS